MPVLADLAEVEPPPEGLYNSGVAIVAPVLDASGRGRAGLAPTPRQASCASGRRVTACWPSGRRAWEVEAGAGGDAGRRRYRPQTPTSSGCGCAGDGAFVRRSSTTRRRPHVGSPGQSGRRVGDAGGGAVRAAASRTRGWGGGGVLGGSLDTPARGGQTARRIADGSEHAGRRLSESIELLRRRRGLRPKGRRVAAHPSAWLISTPQARAKVLRDRLQVPRWETPDWLIQAASRTRWRPPSGTMPRRCPRR